MEFIIECNHIIFTSKRAITSSHFPVDLFALKMFSVLTHVLFFFSLRLALNMARMFVGPFSILCFLPQTNYSSYIFIDVGLWMLQASIMTLKTVIFLLVINCQLLAIWRTINGRYFYFPSWSLQNLPWNLLFLDLFLICCLTDLNYITFLVYHFSANNNHTFAHFIGSFQPTFLSNQTMIYSETKYFALLKDFLTQMYLEIYPSVCFPSLFPF